MTYTVGEMAAMLDVPASTLRYYDKEGLLPFVARSSGGIRQFRDSDLEWLRIIGCMKKAGMSLKDIRQYIQLAMQGNDTIDARRAMEWPDSCPKRNYRHTAHGFHLPQNTTPSTAESKIIPMGDGAFCRIFLYPKCTAHSRPNTTMPRTSGANCPPE